MKRQILFAACALLGATGAMAAPVQWTTESGGNGHYYEFVADYMSWEAALAAAGTNSYRGNQGYLATVTSAEEQAFIYGNVTTNSTWFSGSDRATEGTWIWEAGPEAGQVFWVGDSGGSSPLYANWYAGEPNNWYDEDYLWGNFSGSTWNDISQSNLDYMNAWVGPTSVGYVVEYGGLSAIRAEIAPVPEPTTWAMMIGGFAAIGGAMRFRRRKTTVAFAR